MISLQQKNTIKPKLLSEKNTMTIYSNNKHETIDYFRSLEINIENIYEKDKKQLGYENER